jgi:hypothetical protein
MVWIICLLPLFRQDLWTSLSLLQGESCTCSRYLARHHFLDRFSQFNATVFILPPPALRPAGRLLLWRLSSPLAVIGQWDKIIANSYSYRTMISKLENRRHLILDFQFIKFCRMTVILAVRPRGELNFRDKATC